MMHIKLIALNPSTLRSLITVSHSINNPQIKLNSYFGFTLWTPYSNFDRRNGRTQQVSYVC